MGIFDPIFKKLADAITSQMVGDPKTNPVAISRSYRAGIQPRQLNVKVGQYDDNITQNLCGVITDRAVSQLVGHGFTLDFEGNAETEQERWMNACFDANKQETLWLRAALSAAEAGTGYITYMPDGIIGEDGKAYPRILLIDPLLVTMETLPEDWEIVTKYTVEYKFRGVDGKEMTRKRVYENDPETGRWVIVTYEGKSGPWITNYQEVDRQDWPYDFPPVLHWQNLPSASSPYGVPEIGPDGYELQDKYNAAASNMSKVIRLYAHPKMALINATAGDKVDVGPDSIIKVTTDGNGGGLEQYPPIEDLTSSLAFMAQLRRTLFDITRTVDLDSLEDKLGQLTNFGLRVLYQDNMSKIETKRRIFEDMVEELGRRLLLIAGIQPVPFELVWPEILPVNQQEQTQLFQIMLDLGIISQQTVADKLGLDWEQEQERIDGETQTGYEREPAQ